MPLQSETRKKTYSPPKLNKLTPDQATLLLTGHATCGDQGAKDLLDVLYPPARTRAKSQRSREFRRRGACPNQAWHVPANSSRLDGSPIHKRGFFAFRSRIGRTVAESLAH
jgi:hypothetical protein